MNSRFRFTLSRVLPTALLLAGLAGATASDLHGAAADRVGDWANLDRLDFSGNAAFTPAQLRRGLRKHVPLLTALHPLAPLDALPRALADHVRDGYQAAGFGDVRVSVRLDPAAQRIRVNIIEGTRYLCGDVRVIAEPGLPVGEIVRRLTAQHPTAVHDDFHDVYLDSSGQEVRSPETAWTREHHADFSVPALAELRKRVAQVVADCGAIRAETNVNLVPRPDTPVVDLEIKVSGVTAHPRLGPIAVHDTKRHTPEEVTHWLALDPEREIGPDFVANLERRLWDSGRFTAYRVALSPASGRAGFVQLDLWLTEAIAGPKLGEPFSPEERAMLKFRDWLAQQIAFKSADADDIAIGLPAGSVCPPQFGALEVVMGRAGLLAVRREGSGIGAGVMLSPERRLFYAAQGACKLVSTAPGGQLTVSVLMRPSPETSDRQRTNLTIMAGFESTVSGDASPLRFDVLLAPVSFIRQAHEPDPAVTLAAGVLRIGNDKLTLEIDATTGRLLQARGKTGADPTISVARGRFAELAAELERAAAGAPNRLDREHVASSMLQVLGTELIAGPYLTPWMAPTGTPEQRARAATAVEKLLSGHPLLGWDKELADKAEAPEAFNIPTTPEANDESPKSMLPLFSGLVGLADEFLPPQSWPVRLLHEFAMAVSGDAPYLEFTVSRLARAADTGPIGQLCAVKLLSLMNTAKAVPLAERARQRLAVADFRRDCELLYSPASGLTQAVTALVNGMGNLSPAEIDALAAVLPEPLRPPLIRVAQERRARPSDPPVAALQPLLDEWWTTSLRTQVDAALRALIETPTAETAKTAD